jgi:hypothetical protein
VAFYPLQNRRCKSSYPAFNVDTLSIIPAQKNLKTARKGRGKAARNDDDIKKTEEKHSGSRYADIVSMDFRSDLTVVSSSSIMVLEFSTVASFDFISHESF